MLRIIIAFVAVAVLIYAAAVLIKSQRLRGGRMNEEAVRKAATEFAREQGRNVDDYTVASVAREEGIYRVRFEGKEKRPGNHFTVIVDAASGRATELIPGR